METDIQEMPDQGSWVRNCAMKSAFISKMLKHHKRTVVWIDADAVIVDLRAPFWLGDFDVSAHRLDNQGGRYCSGTVVVQDTEGSAEFLERWEARQAELPDEPDEHVMTKVIEAMPELKVDNLAPEYLYVFDIWKRWYPDVKPGIIHKQASRAFRHRSRSAHPDVIAAIG
jgi:hypothetical protein